MAYMLESNKIENVAKSIVLILTVLTLSFFMFVLFSELNENNVSTSAKFCLCFIILVNTGILLLIYISIREFIKTYL
jgi:hypothetical protein